MQIGTMKSIVYYNEMCQIKHLYEAGNKINKLTGVVTARIYPVNKSRWELSFYGNRDDMK